MMVDVACLRNCLNRKQSKGRKKILEFSKTADF